MKTAGSSIAIRTGPRSKPKHSGWFYFFAFLLCMGAIFAITLHFRFLDCKRELLFDPHVPESRIQEECASHFGFFRFLFSPPEA